MKKLAIVVSLILMVLSLAACDEFLEGFQSGYDNATQESQDQSAADVFNEDDYSSDIDFTDLSHNADSLKGTKVTYRGSIIQKTNSICRIAIGGNSNNVVYANLPRSLDDETLIDGDIIDFWGTVKGQTSYTALLGQTIYLPEIDLEKIAKVDMLSLVKYTDTPFTVTEMSWDEVTVASTTEIESITIKTITTSFDGSLSLELEIVGTVTGTEYLNLEVKIYDADDISLGNTSVFSSISDGEKFRLTESIYVPADTSRIEFVRDEN
jgi:hypothetical protein